MNKSQEHELEWFKVADIKDLPEGRIKSVTARTTSICLVHFDGQWSAMDNRCPHQGGPLGEGSIEKGVEGQCWIRCPWHGWDFDPVKGTPPGGHEDTGQELFPVRLDGDDVLVGLPATGGGVSSRAASPRRHPAPGRGPGTETAARARPAVPATPGSRSCPLPAGR